MVLLLPLRRNSLLRQKLLKNPLLLSSYPSRGGLRLQLLQMGTHSPVCAGFLVDSIGQRHLPLVSIVRLLFLCLYLMIKIKKMFIFIPTKGFILIIIFTLKWSVSLPWHPPVTRILFPLNLSIVTGLHVWTS